MQPISEPSVAATVTESGHFEHLTVTLVSIEMVGKLTILSKLQLNVVEKNHFMYL